MNKTLCDFCGTSLPSIRSWLQVRRTTGIWQVDLCDDRCAADYFSKKDGRDQLAYKSLDAEIKKIADELQEHGRKLKAR